MHKLSELELKVLSACAGEVVRDLPYDTAQREATERLKSLGLIYFTFDDDQPTHYTTPNGEAFLSYSR